MIRYAIFVLAVMSCTAANAKNCLDEAQELRNEFDMVTIERRSTDVTLLWRNQAEVTLWCNNMESRVVSFKIKFLPRVDAEFANDSMAAMLKRFRPKDWRNVLRSVDACSKKLVISDYAQVNPESKAGVLCSRDNGVSYSFYTAG